MTDPLTQLTTPVAADRPSAEFAASLRGRVEAIESRADRTRRSRWHLAQLNLGVFRHTLEAPEMAEFVGALDRINDLADNSPGFVWRLTDADGGPSSNVEVPGATDPLLASNLSVWTDVDALRDFMFRSDHGAYMKRRAAWFERHTEPMTVAWWIPAGTTPTLEEALEKLDHLRANGPTNAAFPITRRIPDPPLDPPPPTEQTMTTQTLQAQTFIPYLAVSDSRAAHQFYAEVFGAEQSGEFFEMDDGRVGHSEMTINGSVFYMADEFPEMELYQPGHERKSPVAIVINVDDCDAVYEHAVAAGATGERPPTNQHGHRSGWFIDPWGHRWSPTSAPKPGQP